MALTRVKSINGLSDPLKQYQCKFHISRGLGTAISGGIIREEDFELRATSWTYPGTTIKTVDTVIFNHYRRRPSLQDKSGTWHVSVTEDMNGSVLQSLQDWCDVIMNPATGVMSPSELYISMASVEICGPGMNNNKRIYLRGFYPIKISDIKIDTSSSQPVTVDVDFNYDWYSEDKMLGL